MPTSVVFFSRGRFSKKKPEKPSDWSNQERAELYRIADLLDRSGLSVGTDSGLSDEGDPWFAFFHPDSGDVIAHFARIDGLFVAAATTAGTTLRGRDFRAVIDQIIERQPLVFPRPDPPGSGQSNNVKKLFLHPAVVLTAFVATAFLHSRKALAETVDDHGTDGRSKDTGTKDGGDVRFLSGARGTDGGATTEAASGGSGGAGGFLFHAASMASALALVISSTKADPLLLDDLGVSDASTDDGGVGPETSPPTLGPSPLSGEDHREMSLFAADQDDATLDALTVSDPTEDAPSATDDEAGELVSHPGSNTIQHTLTVDESQEEAGHSLQEDRFTQAIPLQDHNVILISAGLIQEKSGTQTQEILEAMTAQNEPRTTEQQSGPSHTQSPVTTTTPTMESKSTPDQTLVDTSSWNVPQTDSGRSVSTTLSVTLSGDSAINIKDLNPFTCGLDIITSAVIKDDSDGTPLSSTKTDSLTLAESSDIKDGDKPSVPATIDISDGTLDLSNDTTEVIHYEGGDVELVGYQVGVDSILVDNMLDTTAAQMDQTADGSIMLCFGTDGTITLVGVTVADLAAIG
jgi:hypothetical protein